MASFDRDLTAITKSLRNRGCQVGREWLTDCVNFFRSENNQYTLHDLEKLVFDQWLLADLTDIAGVGSFPPNLSGKVKTTLEGIMACQVQLVTDIGHSSYSQWQKLKNQDVGNLEVNENGKEFAQAWEPKANQMLQLTLFDGVQTIKAIEYRPIPVLKADMIPGTKISLRGPLLSRRGILMLEEKHVTILGGEVDALVIVNAYENVLARKLNLPENPDPYNMATVRNNLPEAQQANMQPAQQTVPPQTVTSIQNPPQGPEINNFDRNRQISHSAATHAPREQVTKRTSLTNPAISSMTRTPQEPLLEFCDDDEDFLNIPLNEAEWESEMDVQSGRASNTSHPTNHTKNLSEFDMGSEDEALFLEAEASLALTENAMVASTERPPPERLLPATVSKNPEEPSCFKRAASAALPEESLRKPLFSKRRKETSSQEVSSTTDLKYMCGDDLLNFETPSVPTSRPVPCRLDPMPFVYLSQVLEQKQHCKTYRVKAAVITVINKLMISDGEWKLSAKISDGSANVDVKFSNEVLEELIGISATTMKELKKQMVTQPEKKEFVRKKLEKAQRRLINLNCLLDIKSESEEELPTVVCLEQISTDTVGALRSRLSLV